MKQPPARTRRKKRQRETASLSYRAVQFRREVFHGPLPHPQILREYEDILPGGADRVFAMAEEEGKNRRKIQRIQARTPRWGIVASVLVAAGFLGCGTWLISVGRSVGGLAVIAAELVGIVVAYVAGRKDTPNQE